ncbi:MAG: hypothetical protein MUD02_06715 [Bacteroidales bacterium]|nr:hypothetical protein [Bacteroidales bacterium]
MAYSANSKTGAGPLEPRCRKEAYTSMEDAQAMVQHISETRITREIRAYKCPVCGYWHLTSRAR